jgi:acetyl-CoA acyltransferase
MGSPTAGTADTSGERFRLRYPDGMVPQGVSAELIAARWGLGRGALDEFALRSQERAGASRAFFEGEIAPLKVRDEHGGLTIVAADEGIRPTTLDGLARLRPAFADDRWTERFPQIDWSVTAGNSSQMERPPCWWRVPNGPPSSVCDPEPEWCRWRWRVTTRCTC